MPLPLLWGLVGASTSNSGGPLCDLAFLSPTAAAAAEATPAVAAAATAAEAAEAKAISPNRSRIQKSSTQ